MFVSVRVRGGGVGKGRRGLRESHRKRNKARLTLPNTHTQQNKTKQNNTTHSVAEGNSELVKRLFNASRAEVRLSTAVTSVAKQEDGTFLVSWKDGGESRAEREETAKRKVDVPAATAPEEDSAIFDYVVVACPFEFLGVEWSGFGAETAFPKPREFRHWFVTVVRAEGVDPSYFGMDGVKEFP